MSQKDDKPESPADEKIKPKPVKPASIPLPPGAGAALGGPPVPPPGIAHPALGQVSPDTPIGRPQGGRAAARANAAAQAAPRPKRDLGKLGAPSEQEKTARERVATARRTIGATVAAIDEGVAAIKAMVAGLRNYQGGAEIAAAEGFDIDRAESFADRLDALADEFAPKQG